MHDQGAWVAQSVECLTLDFGSGHDPRVLGSSPVSGSLLGAEPTWDSSSPSVPPIRAHVLVRALSLKIKHTHTQIQVHNHKIKITFKNIKIRQIKMVPGRYKIATT